MPGSLVCVDASTVVSLVTAQISSIRPQFEKWEFSRVGIGAPALLYYEVTSALYRYQFEKWLSRESTFLALETALALNIRLYADAHLHRTATGLATELSLAATYDCHYLALSERLRVESWTADKKLYRKIKKQFPNIRLFT